MILDKRAVTLAEVKEIVVNLDEKPVLNEYLKTFTKLTSDKAKKLFHELKELNNVKLNDEKIVKIVDILPKSKEELNKILIDTSLSEEESNAILGIVKKY
jgi:DNA-directed RNA polymerase subunit F